MQCPSVQIHLYILLYDNAVVLFPPAFSAYWWYTGSDLQRLSVSWQITHGGEIMRSHSLCFLLFFCFVFLPLSFFLLPGSTFTKTHDRNTTFISIIKIGKRKKRQKREKTGRKRRRNQLVETWHPLVISVSGCSWGNAPGRFWCVFMAALPLCFFYYHYS